MDHQPITVVATLTVRVPLNASGSLVDGAVRTLERTPAVETVTDPDVRGLAPALNETTVDLRARVTIAVGDRGEDVALARRELEAGVGVTDVEILEVGDDGPLLRATLE
ncbi:hypothetical protein [Natrononativus amylolyticus]|uniref:hypothetical protein n=1 Tax=Natrononativus amylolyticus TaxID=2963434 RepID=UPI0020CC0826|nr:hypothetical protein [Natrononativus amylolyticus]